MSCTVASFWTTEAEEAVVYQGDKLKYWLGKLHSHSEVVRVRAADAREAGVVREHEVHAVLAQHVEADLRAGDFKPSVG